MAENGEQTAHAADPLISKIDGLSARIGELQAKIDHHHEDYKKATATYHPVLEGLGKAFDITPSEASEDTRPEARYLQENINWWAEFKNDPMFPVNFFIYNFFIPGLGIFSEGFILFSNGNLKTLYRQTWPACWETYEVCNRSWVQSVDYLQITGILCGQFTLGFAADALGRRKVQIFDAVMMTIGLILITAATGSSLNSWVIMLAWAFFFYGFGVGGEYPTTSSIAAEKAESSAALMKKRGRTVLLTFALQGWGQLVNVSVLLILLLIFNSSGNPPYSAGAAGATWRTSYALMFPFLLFLIYWRVFRQRENKNYERVKDEFQEHGGERKEEYDGRSLRLMARYLWPRMIATQLGWFCNDFGFYGSKVFIGQIIQIISPGSGVQTTWLWTMLSTGCALCGYYAAALLVDWRPYGRRKMQMVGFLVLFVLYLIVAAAWVPLTSDNGVAVFQFIFYLQAFFQQFGPNCTSFLVAAEVYPTPVRATGHGMSAATGKLGALIPEIIFNYVGNRTRFWVTTWFNLLGFAVTYLFLPDTTGLDLSELDRWWDVLRNRRGHEYKGEAVNPAYLSPFERWVMKYHRSYDPQAAAAEEEADERELGDGLKRLSMSTSKGKRTNDSLRALSMGSSVTHRKSAAASELEMPPKE